MDAWPAERRVIKRRGRGKTSRPIDLRPLVTEMRLDGATLHVTLAPVGDLWARPAELLELVGLDQRVDLARTVRTAVQYEP